MKMTFSSLLQSDTDPGVCPGVGMTVNGRCHIDARNINSYQTSFEVLIKDLRRWKKEKTW